MFGYLSCAVHKLNKALGLCVSIHVEAIVGKGNCGCLVYMKFKCQVLYVKVLMEIRNVRWTIATATEFL